VAAIVGADVADVLVAGYANAYIHYVTTPEEYDAQRYEGGSTLFGRWELGAFVQVASDLARAMREGVAVPCGVRPPDPSRRNRRRRRRRTDEAPAGHGFGDVVAGPRERYAPGEQVLVRFVGAHPNNDLHRGGTFVEVQQADSGGWRTVADDSDWSTKIRWDRAGRNGSRITVSWDLPPAVPAGRYRIRYRGDAADRHGRLAPFVACTAPFEVTAAA
jgi:neutral ceramidase